MTGSLKQRARLLRTISIVIAAGAVAAGVAALYLGNPVLLAINAAIAGVCGTLALVNHRMTGD